MGLALQPLGRHGTSAASHGTRSNIYWDGEVSLNGPVAGDRRPAWIK